MMVAKLLGVKEKKKKVKKRKKKLYVKKEMGQKNIILTIRILDSLDVNGFSDISQP